MGGAQREGSQMVYPNTVYALGHTAIFLYILLIIKPQCAVVQRYACTYLHLNSLALHFLNRKSKMLLYLLADGSSHSYWEESDDASAQVFSFPLLTEQT